MTLYGAADIPACLLKQLDATQLVLQMVDGAAERGLGNAQPCGSQGIMLHLGQHGKISQIIVVHGYASNL